MTIMASRPVRSTDRLIDAPTATIPPVPRPRPTGDRARQAYAALTAPGVKASHLATVAKAFGTTARELVDLAIEYAEQHPDAPVYADRTAAACPVWCTSRHGAVDVAAGYGLSHETTPTELVGDDPAYLDTPATVAAWVERTDDQPGQGTPPRVVVSVTEGAGGHYPGSEGVQGWSGTVEQVVQLGRSLLALAQVVRVEQSAPAGAAYRVDVFTADDVLMTSRTVTAVDDRAAEVAARRLVDELGGAVMAAVFTASLVYVGTVTA